MMLNKQKAQQKYFDFFVTIQAWPYQSYANFQTEKVMTYF